MSGGLGVKQAGDASVGSRVAAKQHREFMRVDVTQITTSHAFAS
jgi:hypothetical protein